MRPPHGEQGIAAGAKGEAAVEPVAIRDFTCYTKRLGERSKISFWDALIIVAALRSGAGALLTEDLQDGRKIGEMTIRNPFD